MNKKILPWVISFSALLVSGSAGFYSVYGLGKMFAGASIQVMILAGSLELSKLVTASLLYRYWDDLNKFLKTYLLIATFILILITSAGIYGFLSGAYKETANKYEITEQKIISLETKKNLYEKSRDNYIKEKESISKSLENLRNGLSANSTTQYVDKKGNLIISANNSGRKSLESQLFSLNRNDSIVSKKIETTNDSIFNIENQIIDTKTNSTISDELGPLRYISDLTGKSLDYIVNWYIIVMMLVFDPLAISLVIAANFAFEKLKEEKEKESIFEEIKKDIIEEISENSEIHEIIEESLINQEEISEEELEEKLEEIIEEKVSEIEEITEEEKQDIIEEIKEELIESIEEGEIIEDTQKSDIYKEETKNKEYGGYRIHGSVPVSRNEDPLKLP
jgi:hypothetical protein